MKSWAMFQHDTFECQPALGVQFTTVIAVLAPQQLLDVCHKGFLRHCRVPAPVAEARRCLRTEKTAGISFALLQ